MKKKTNKLKPFIAKLRFKYRVSILNENTLEESWHVRLSRFSVFMFVSSFIALTFILLTILIFTTPISRYLPGYGETGNRSNIIKESMRTDSLVKQVELQEGYVDIIKGIINGKMKPDSIASLDSIALKQRAKILLEKTKREKTFVENFEKEEKYNLASIDTKPTESTYVFFRPTRGVISSSYNLSEQQYGIYLITSPNESVVSVLAGTVVYAAFTFDYGWVVQVQHDNNYLSIYKNNTRVLKRVGDEVKAGECIAITGDASKKKAGNQFYFELWKQGKPVDPEEVIIF
ncbi:MAG: M23 family metallopeptidase [Bacteroidota bacterium]|nr:M23 family metallopeptidase [Bacteroidota bacterium]